jgi:hypothetical protein
MPALIKPHEVKVTTKDGEVQVAITLDLNINLNAAGLHVTAKVAGEQKEETQWEIPDFEPSPKINFGKKE